MVLGGMVPHIWRAIKKNPILFNGTTGGLLCATSDVMAQTVEHYNPLHNDNLGNLDDNHRRSTSENSSSPIASSATNSVSSILLPSRQIDWFRLCGATGIGALFGGLIYPFAYAKLDAIWVGTQFLTVVKKSLVEIATVGIFVNTTSMTARGCLRGDQEGSAVMQHVISELPTVTQSDFLVWMPYNMVAFSLIPAFLRPTTTALMEALWQTYISLRSHDYDSKKEKASSVSLKTANVD